MQSKGSPLRWGAAPALVMLSVGCAQVLGLDHDFEQTGAGAGGAASSGSSGEGGSSSSGSGSGGSNPGDLILEWRATEPVIVSGAPCTKIYTYTLPDAFEFASPFDGERTSQIGPEQLCRGYTKDVPRARNAGAGWGLSIESDRKNFMTNSDSWDSSKAGWASGTMMVTLARPDLAGGTAATLFTASGNGTGTYSNHAAPKSGGNVASAWLRGGLGQAPFAHFHHGFTGSWVDVDTTSWKRYSIVSPNGLMGEIAFGTTDTPQGSGVIPGVRSVYAFGAQVEGDALYPSSYIPTLDNPQTRSPERLYTKQGALASLVPDGYFDILIKFAPNYELSLGVNEMWETELDILFFSAATGVRLRAADRKLIMRVDHVTIELGPVTFSREQELTLRVTNRKGQGFSMELSGATEGNGSATGMPDFAIQTAQLSQLHLFSSDGGSAKECQDLRYMGFFKP